MITFQNLSSGINPENTVGEIVANNYNTAGVFRKFNLDFCCGGGISLKKACSDNEVDLNEILAELEKLQIHPSTGSENYLAWEAEYLINHIIDTHHRYVRIKTDEISAYAQKVAAVHGERHPENIQILYKFNDLTQEMMVHLQAEEETVFPLITSVSQKRKRGEEITLQEINKLKNQLELMVADHDGAGQLMNEIRDLSNQYNAPQDACATYQILYKNLEGFEQDLHKHVHLENNILFRKAEELI